MLTKEQVEERINYLGSSDAAGVLGLSSYQTPLSIWCIKTGTLPPVDISQKMHVRLGNKMERIVAELFEEETGKRVQRVNETIYHKEYPFLAANIDRRVIGENAILEIKTTSAWQKQKWADNETPQEYLVQIFHQLAITGMRKAYLCCLIGNQEIQIREIDRDPIAFAELIKREVIFWKEFIEPKIMPMQVSSADSMTLARLFPEGIADKEIDLSDEANKIIESRNAMIQDKITLEKQIDQSENILKLMLKDATIGKTNLWKVTWRNQTRKEHMVKASTFRAFKIIETREEI